MKSQVVSFALLVLAAVSAAANAADLWTRFTPTEAEIKVHPMSVLRSDSPHQTLVLDERRLEQILRSAALELRTPGIATILSIPKPDGGLERFEISESPVVEEGLALWLKKNGWPIKTYRGRSLDRPSTTMRLDWGGPGGFHAMIIAPRETYLVDPLKKGDRLRYISYRRKDSEPSGTFRCVVAKSGQQQESLVGLEEATQTNATTIPDRPHLNIYRTAIAVTGDYTQQLHGGSKVAAQAELVTLVNRVNAIYERDLSVRLQLIENNWEIVYDNAETDPYTEFNYVLMQSENINNLSNVIGNENFDLGHVIFSGGGGYAILGSPCTSVKAGGVSGAGIDHLLHELGHQFGATHTFNSSQSFCGPAREPSSAWEPGAGTTIMGYGICGSDFIEGWFEQDEYFHGGSLNQMLRWIDIFGNCADLQPTSNQNAPVVSATGGHVIPAMTPFELEPDSASDADNDSLTFTWEQYDVGASASFADGDLGDNPIFRSLPPSVNPIRRIDGDRNGEILPTTTRSLNFQVTVRDNHPVSGRVGTANIALSVDNTTGPFQVISPNGGEAYEAASTLPVVWSVAGTDGDPVNVDSVALLMSLDSGETYDIPLEATSANDGNQLVPLPAVVSHKARIKVRAIGNIFYDQSDQDFSLGYSSVCITPQAEIPTFTPVTSDLTVEGQLGLASGLDVSVNIQYPIPGALKVTLAHVESGKSVLLMNRPGVSEDNPVYGCATANIDVMFDDEGDQPVASVCNANPPGLGGYLLPENPLSVFNDVPKNGTWRLEVVEPVVSFDGVKILEEICLYFPVDLPPEGLLFRDGFEN